MWLRNSATMGLILGLKKGPENHTLKAFLKSSLNVKQKWNCWQTLHRLWITLQYIWHLCKHRLVITSSPAVTLCLTLMYFLFSWMSPFLLYLSVSNLWLSDYRSCSILIFELESGLKNALTSDHWHYPDPKILLSKPKLCLWDVVCFVNPKTEPEIANSALIRWLEKQSIDLAPTLMWLRK